MKINTERTNKLPIHDIKGYTYKWLAENKLMDVHCDEAEKDEIGHLIYNLRRSKRTDELYDDEVYIYEGTRELSGKQIMFLKEMANDLDLIYDYFKGFHCLYKMDFTEMFKIN